QYLSKSQLTTENLRLSLHNAIKQGELLRQVAALKLQNQRHLEVLTQNIVDRQQVQQILQNQLEQQRLVMDMTGRIRRSIDLPEILQTTVNELRQFLQTDRVIIYQFGSDWSGRAICESVGADWKAVRGTYIYNTECIESDLGHYQQGLTTVRSDIYNVHIDAWQMQLLESFQVRANIVVPIFKGNQLWGLLSCHHCSAPRLWQTVEVDSLEQLASQVSIAIQQADLFTRAQIELTQRKQAEMTLQLLNAELKQRQAVEKLKDEFIGIVSHELRTPLTSMQGALGLLAMGLIDDDPAQMKQMIQIAASETERLVRMVNDILDLEKLAADSNSFEQEWCDAAALLQRSVEVMSSSAEAAGVRLELDCPPIQIWVTPDRIVQIFTNLLSNAIKFSAPGGVVSIEAKPLDDSGSPSAQLVATSPSQQIRFAISDRGRGIPEHKLETIFDRFQQVDNSDARDKGGTGLGLAICQSIVLQHQGRIWVESIWGQGSTFFVTLPQPMNKNRSN
ncbi:MAG: GAF domain-containing protein, partial [Chamaesiphon sp.]|nr:GAF domain-containing protein [Chamaesiphon sp.]